MACIAEKEIIVTITSYCHRTHVSRDFGMFRGGRGALNAKSS